MLPLLLAAVTLVPLHGVPLAGPTHLRLLVSARTPFVYDVDDHRVTRVRGIPRRPDTVLWVAPSPGGPVAIRDRTCDGCTPAETAYRVAADGRAHVIAAGASVTPAASSAGMWVLARTRGGCTLRLAPGGHAVRTPCGYLSGEIAGGPVLTVGRRVVVVDPATGKTRPAPAMGMSLPGGASLALAGRAFLLTRSDGTTSLVRWPSILDRFDAALPAPTGQAALLTFADPAWNGGPTQARDAWLLDVATGAVSAVPGFPALSRLKFSDLQWAPDGRLVYLARGGQGLLGVWTPGQPQLAVRHVRLPAEDSGSASFVAY
jgi:hypothetical protein